MPSSLLDLWERLISHQIPPESLWGCTEGLLGESQMPASLFRDLQKAYGTLKPRLWSLFKPLREAMDRRCWTKFREQEYREARLTLGVVLVDLRLHRGMAGWLKIGATPASLRDSCGGKILLDIAKAQILQTQGAQSAEKEARERVENFLAPFLIERLGTRWWKQWKETWFRSWVLEVGPSLGMFLQQGMIGKSWTFPISALLLGFLFRRRILPEIVMTGAWDQGGNAVPVEYLDEKVDAIRAENLLTSSRFTEMWIPYGNLYGGKKVTEITQVEGANGLKLIPIKTMREFCDRLVPEWTRSLSSLVLPDWGRCLGIVGEIISEFQETGDAIVGVPLSQVYLDASLDFYDKARQGNTENKTIVLGPSGIGKSSFCKNAAFLQAEKYRQNPDREKLPLLLSLRRCSNVGSAIAETLGISPEIAQGSSLSSPALYENLALWLDGLDESTDAPSLLMQFGLFSRVSCRVVVTCRNHFFESLRRLGYLPQEDWNIASLSLSLDFLSRYLARWEMQKAFIPEFLASRPLFLAIMSVSFSLTHGPTSTNLSYLYSHCIRNLIERRQKSEDEMDMETHRQFLEVIALFSWQHGKKAWNLRDWTLLKQEKWIEHFSLVADFLASPETKPKDLHKFFLHSSIFTGDSNQWQYIHESFGEYCLASAISQFWQREGNLTPLRWRSLSHEVIAFAAELPSKCIPWSALEKESFWASMNGQDVLRLLRSSLGSPLRLRIPLAVALLWLISIATNLLTQDFSWDNFLLLPYFLSNPHLEILQWDFDLWGRIAVSSQTGKTLLALAAAVFCYAFVHQWKKGWLPISNLRLNSLNLLAALFSNADILYQKKAERARMLLHSILKKPPADKGLQLGLAASRQILGSQGEEKSWLLGIKGSLSWRNILSNIALQRGKGKWKSEFIENELQKNLDLQNLRLSEYPQNPGNLDGLRLKKCNLSGWYAPGISLRKSVLPGCYCSKADLRSASFRDADLRWCDFQKSDLADADFTGADLQGADFTKCRLQGAIFANARLRDTHFAQAQVQDADFSQAQGLEEAWLARAKGLEEARFPVAMSLRKIRLQEWLSRVVLLIGWMILLCSMYCLSLENSFLSESAYLWTGIVVGTMLGVTGKRQYPAFSKRLLSFSLLLTWLAALACEKNLHPELRFGSHGAELWGLGLAWFAASCVYTARTWREKFSYSGSLLPSLLALYLIATALRFGESLAGQVVSTFWACESFSYLAEVSPFSLPYFLWQIFFTFGISAIFWILLQMVAFWMGQGRNSRWRRVLFLMSLLVWLKLLILFGYL